MDAINTSIAEEVLAKVEAFVTVIPTIFRADMQQLELTHPEIYSKLPQLLTWPIDQRRLKVNRWSDWHIAEPNRSNGGF